MARTLVPTVTVEPTKATLTTAIAGTHNDLKFTAAKGGQWGNDITIAYIEPGASSSLEVLVQGFAIIVNLETDGSNNATSTAAEVLAALQAAGAVGRDVAALVTVELAASNDGTGIVDAFAATNLAGGTYSVAQPALTNGDATNDHYITGNEGDTIIEVVSTDAGAQTVTIHYAARALGGGASIEPEVVAVAAGATVELPPLPPALFNQNTDGDVYFDPSVSSTLDFRAYKVEKRLG